MDVKKLMPSAEALQAIVSSMPQMGSELIPIASSRGRILFEDAVASEDVPRYANSSMDGFALLDTVTADATPETPVHLSIIGEAAAGSPFRGDWDPQAGTVRIMTGGIVPEGANAVVELELVTESGGGIGLTRPVPRGRNIRLVGEDVRRGETVLTKGTVMEAEHIGMLATMGYAEVGVARKPAVSVITTGSELVDPTSVPGPGKIRNSSLFMVPAYVEEAGGQIAGSGSVGDDKDALKEALRSAWDADMVITMGGVSVGKYDLVPTVLKELDVEVKVAGVNIKPGKPFTFGVAPNGTPVFCLPGNPVSTAVTFWRFVRPALDHMMGRRQRNQVHCRAQLGEAIEKKDTKEHFLRGIVTMGDTLPVVRRTGIQSSGVLSSMARANCLIVLPPEARTFAAGEVVEIQLL